MENINNRLEKIKRLSKEWFAKIELVNTIPDFIDLKQYLNFQIKVQKKSQAKIHAACIYLDDTIRSFIKEITNGTKLIQQRRDTKLDNQSVS